MTILNKKDVVFDFICQGWSLVLCLTGPESPWQWEVRSKWNQEENCWMWDELNNLCLECFQIWTLVVVHLFILPCFSSSSTHLWMPVGCQWQVSVLEPRINQQVRLRVGFPGGTVVKNPPANARNMGSSPDQKNPPEKEMTTHPSVLAREVPWTEEPGGMQFTRTQLSD